MDLRTRLDRTLEEQRVVADAFEDEDIASYECVARSYAAMENAIAVLSDMHSRSSRIFCGGLAGVLGIAAAPDGMRIDSIWEEDILERVHPDDLEGKYLSELHYFRFVKRQPAAIRGRYYLMSRLRMRAATGVYVPVVHRMFYIYGGRTDAVRLALCLYNAAVADAVTEHVIVDSVSGAVHDAGVRAGSQLLSRRERDILRLVDKGLPSKAIADMLSISINTVSRHRQEILAKLQVKNSIEACRLANRLKLI